MEVEFAPSDIFAVLVQIKRSVTRLGFDQHGGIHGIVEIGFLWIGLGVSDIHFPQEDASGTFFEHTKDATGDAELRIFLTMQEGEGDVSPIADSAALIVAIEKS